MELSRRSFLRSAAAVAGAAGVGALASTGLAHADEAEEAEEATTEEAGTITYDQTIAWDGQYDVVVCGFGAAGASTAITAADAGANVLVLEKAPLGEEGGNSRYCAQAFVTSQGDLEEIQSYYSQLYGDFDISEDILTVFTEGIAGIEENYANLFGLDTADFMYFDADSTSESFTLPILVNLSPEYPEFASEDTTIRLAELHEGYSDAYMWQNYRQQVVNRSDSIDVWFESPAIDLIQEPNTKTILGVKVSRGGEELNIRATNGVVLTTGGFENNRTMLEDYLGLTNSAYYGTEYNTGDGINMAKAAGADLWHMHAWESQCMNAGLSFPVESGSRGKLFSFVSTQGSYIIIGGDGYRIWDESEIYVRHGHIYHNGVWDNPWYPNKLFMVCDSSDASFFEESVEGTYEYYQADTIEELAELIGTTEGILEQTIEDYNSFAEAGYDPAFHRDGDSMHAIEEAPFYAIELVVSVLNTQGGPRRNASSEVVDVDGNAIPHLYSAGECGGICANMYQGGGNMAECLIFGQVAGENAAAEKDPLDAYVVEAVESDLVYTIGVANDILEDESEEAETETDDGTLTGTGTGIGGDFEVYVTVDEDGVITSVEVGENSETDGIGSVAIEELPEQFIGLSTAEEIDAVDGTSGATVTSNAIKEAIKDALGLE